MRILLDTNVLLRSVETDHPQHPIAEAAIVALTERGDRLLLVPQVIYEFWVVATRPAEVNGLGMPPEEAPERVQDSLEIHTLLRDERAIFDHWLEFVAAHAVRGVNAHDTRLAAAMRRHRVAAILTFNARHFRRFDEIAVLEPGAVTAGE